MSAQLINDAISQRKITFTTACDVISIAMEIIDTFKVPGSFKSETVINVLQSIVNNYTGVVPEKVVAELKLLLDNNLVQPTIDVIVAASRGQLNIGKVETLCSSWIKCLFPKTK